MKLASPNKDRTFLPPRPPTGSAAPAISPGPVSTHGASAPLSNEQVGAEFSETISDLPDKEAARLAHRTPAAAKKWRSRANAPDSASLINVAFSHRRTRAWLLWRVAGDWSRLLEPNVLSELVAVLLRAADGGDARARRILQELHR